MKVFYVKQILILCFFFLWFYQIVGLNSWGLDVTDVMKPVRNFPTAVAACFFIAAGLVHLSQAFDASKRMLSPFCVTIVVPSLFAH
jgi:hypothetical protein